MAPQRPHSSNIEYKKRNLYDDFLDQFKSSISDKYQGQRFAHGQTLGDGLVNKAYKISDASVPMLGLSMFMVQFGQRNLPAHFIDTTIRSGKVDYTYCIHECGLIESSCR